MAPLDELTTELALEDVVVEMVWSAVCVCVCDGSGNDATMLSLEDEATATLVVEDADDSVEAAAGAEAAGEVLDVRAASTDATGAGVLIGDASDSFSAALWLNSTDNGDDDTDSGDEIGEAPGDESRHSS